MKGPAGLKIKVWGLKWCKIEMKGQTAAIDLVRFAASWFVLLISASCSAFSEASGIGTSEVGGGGGGASG